MPTIHKIMMAIDLSENSESFVDFAVNFTHQMNAELWIMYVIQEIEVKTAERIAGEYRLFSTKEYISRLNREYSEKIDKLSQGIMQMNLKIKTVIKAGKIVDELKKEIIANKIDILLMASKGRKEISDYVLGSCIRKMLHASVIPVVVFPISKLK